MQEAPTVSSAEGDVAYSGMLCGALHSRHRPQSPQQSDTITDKSLFKRVGLWFGLGMVGLSLCVVFTTHVYGADNPDALYQEGRYDEAEKIYSQKDMDNPKDTRYRYNRGCAAYQKSDYEGALAAFSSVVRRAKNDEVRFKAAYNLGNAAWRAGRTLRFDATNYRLIGDQDAERYLTEKNTASHGCYPHWTKYKLISRTTAKQWPDWQSWHSGSIPRLPGN